MLTRKLMIAASLGLIVIAASSAAPPAGGLSLQQALDKPIDSIVIEKTPILEVFRKFTDKTGVPFVVDEQTLACLPYGDQTCLTVRLRNVTIRKDLSQVLAPEALQWIVEGDTVRIVPSEALARMCRRASFDELQVLGKLYTEKVSAVKGATTIEQLRKVTEANDLDLAFQATGDKAAAIAQADKALPVTGAEWLDRLCQQGPWTWYLWGDQVIVLNRKAQVERQLQQQVKLRHQNETLTTILLDLARKARVTLAMEPGVMNYVPSEVRNNFNLVMADAPIRQALEVISGATGLEFLRTDEGLKVVPSEKLLKGGGSEPGARKTPFFVRMTIPGPGGSSIDVFFRPEELPEEMVQQIEVEKNKMIERWKAARPAGATTAPFSVPREVNH